MLLSEKLRQTIRDVQDYPNPGIVFKDITPVLANPELVNEAVGEMVAFYKTMQIDAVVAVEARGFILGSILAHQLHCPFIPIRKAGKLPFKTMRQDYDLEYGSAAIEIHIDAIKPGWKVLIHDDLLATGGTAGAAAELIKRCGGHISAFSFLANLSFLPGEENLKQRFGVNPHYIISY